MRFGRSETLRPGGVTYDTKVNYIFEVVNSVQELSNDAIVIGIANGPLKGDEGYALGVANDNYSGALIDAKVLMDGKINTIGASVINHEIAHLFGASHSSANGNTHNVMYPAATGGTEFTENQIVEMMRQGVGNWDYIWNKKERGKDLKEEAKHKDVKSDFIMLKNIHSGR